MNRASAPTENLGKMVFGWNVWPGVLPYLVAYEKGFFNKYGLDVEVKEEESYTKMLDDWTNKKIDFVPDMVFIDAIKLKANGQDPRVVGVSDYSNGADGIVAGANINSVADLKGKKVAVELGSFGEYLLLSVLQKYDINPKDVIKVNYVAQEAAEALMDNKVDAAVTSEPGLSVAIQRGRKKIFSTSDDINFIIDTLVFSEEYAEANPKKVKAALAAYFEAIDFIKNNPEEVNMLGAKYFKISPQEFGEYLKGVTLADKRINLTYFSYAAGVDSLYGIYKELSIFLLQNGLIKKQMDGESIIDSSFVRDLYGL